MATLDFLGAQERKKNVQWHLKCPNLHSIVISTDCLSCLILSSFFSLGASCFSVRTTEILRSQQHHKRKRQNLLEIFHLDCVQASPWRCSFNAFLGAPSSTNRRRAQEVLGGRSCPCAQPQLPTPQDGRSIGGCLHSNSKGTELPCGKLLCFPVQYNQPSGPLLRSTCNGCWHRDSPSPLWKGGGGGI